MKNSIKKLMVCMFAGMIMGISPVMAMKRGYEGEENSPKRLKQDVQDPMEEVITLDEVASTVDWDAIATAIEEEDIQEILNVHIPTLSTTEDFDRLFLLTHACQFSDEEMTSFEELVFQKVSPLVKALCDNDYNALQAILILQKCEPKLDHLLYTLVFDKIKLFKLLLSNAKFDIQGQGSYIAGSLCGNICAGDIDDTTKRELLKYIVDAGYAITYDDLYFVSHPPFVRQFPVVLDFVKDINNLPNNPHGKSILFEILKTNGCEAVVEALCNKGFKCDDIEGLLTRAFKYYQRIEYTDTKVMDCVLKILGIDTSHEIYQYYVKRYNDSNELLGYISKREQENIEKYLVHDDLNAYFGIFDNFVAAAAQQTRSADIVTLLLSCGAQFGMYSGYTYTPQDPIVALSKTLDTMHNYDKQNIMKYVESDYAKKQCYFVKLLLRNHPQVAQQLLVHAPYQFINPAIQKRILIKDMYCKDSDTYQDVIQVVSAKEWLEHELKCNAQRVNKEGELNPDAQKLYTWFVMGKHLTNMNYAKKLTDVRTSFK